MSEYLIDFYNGNMLIAYKKSGLLPKKITVDPNDGNASLIYIPERTCTPVRDIDGFSRCSKCNAPIGTYENIFNYCHNCGSKVVK